MDNSEPEAWSHIPFVIGVFAIIIGILLFFLVDRLVLGTVTHLGPLLIVFGIVFMLLDLAIWKKAGKVEQR